MPRQARPRWNPARRRWYANIGEPDAGGRATEVLAPADVGERQEDRAWAWFREEKARRAARVVDPADLTVEQVAELYLHWAEARAGEGRLAPEHYTNKALHLGHFADALGDRRARSLSPADMTAFAERISGRYAPSYARNLCATASAALNWAVRSGHLVANPVKGYEAPVVPRSPERFAERREAAAFLALWRRSVDRESVRGRYARLTMLLVRCLIRTGARPGEMCALWWSDLKWKGGVTSAGHAFAKGEIPFDRWKVGRKTGRARTVYFSPALSRALRREFDRPDRHPRNVFMHGAGRGGAGAGGPWESGSRLAKTILGARRAAIAAMEDMRRRRDEPGPWRPLTAFEAWAAGVVILDEGANRLVNYRFRHTAASTLLMMGVDVPTVAELLGTSPEMIFRVYGHLLDRHLSAAAEKLGGRRSGG